MAVKSPWIVDEMELIHDEIWLDEEEEVAVWMRLCPRVEVLSWREVSM